MKNFSFKVICIFLLVLNLSLVGCKSSSKEEVLPPVVYPEVDYDSSFTTYQYDNSDNVTLDKYIFKDENIYSTYQWNSTWFGSGMPRPTIFVYEHLIMLPEEKEYELFIRGLGDVRVYMGDSYESLSLKVDKSWSEVSSYDFYDDTTYFKVDNKIGKPICLRVEVSASVRAEFYIGSINNTGNIVNISNDYIALFKKGVSE